MEALADHAQAAPDKLCVADIAAEVCYREAWERVKIASQKLREKGIGPSDFVAVECTQNADFLFACLGCQLLGAVSVPLEKGASIERVTEIAGETEAKLVISRTAYALEHTMPIDELFSARAEAPEPEAFPDAEAVAEILYTTGTTGKSKGIVLTNGNNVAVAENIIDGTKMKPESIELIPLPLSHSHGLRSCYADLLNGSTMVLADGVMRVKQVFELIEKYQVNAFDLSPSAAKILIRLSNGSFGRYSGRTDFIQIGTAVLEEELKQELCRLFPDSRLYNFYGSTEAGRSCALDFNREKDRPGCIGRPTCHARFIVTDEERKVIRSDKDHMGLLAVAGEMNMQGYFKAQALTDEILRDGYIYTTDLSYIDEEGFVYVLGRADDVINYQGIKIAPEEIEMHARHCKGVKECACVPVSDPICGQVPKLFVVVQDGARFDKAQALSELAEHIDANKMPKKIEVIDEIPKTSNGKILRRKLREL